MGYLKKKMPLVLLIIVMLFITVLNVWWITMDHGEMYRTEQPKFVTVRSYIDKNFSYEECAYYPPAYFWVCAKTVSLLKIPLSYDRCALVNIFYLVFAMAGMFLLGRSLTSSDWYGLVAALLLLGVPAYLHISRKFIGEFAVTTCVIFAMYFLISNCRWQDKGKSLLFGLVCGIGMLFKWSFLAYVIGPLLISVSYNYFNRKQGSRKDFFHHFFLSVLVAVIVCGYWYAVRFDTGRFSNEFFDNLYDVKYVSSSYFLFLRYNFLRSLQVFVLSGSWFFCLLVLTALAVSAKKLCRRIDYAMVLSGFVFSYIIFLCLGGDILPRYILPAIPALVLVVVLAFCSNDRKRNMFFLLILTCFSLASICKESFINRPPQKYIPTKFDVVLEHILNKEAAPRVIFNGINDEVTEGETLDICNLFYVHDIERRLGMALIYIKTEQELMQNIHGSFILSQDIPENNYLHHYIQQNKYVLADRFSHYFHENTDPSNDWESHGDYLLFEKKE